MQLCTGHELMVALGFKDNKYLKENPRNLLQMIWNEGKISWKR